MQKVAAKVSIETSLQMTWLLVLVTIIIWVSVDTDTNETGDYLPITDICYWYWSNPSSHNKSLASTN